MTMPRKASNESDLNMVPIAGTWWLIGLRGLLAIALGVLAVSWPVLTLLILGLVFAGYCLIDGMLSIVLAIHGAGRQKGWWWSAFRGVIALAAAAFIVFYPGVTMFVFVALLVAWALLNGAIAIAAALRSGRVEGRGWFILHGTVSVVLAMLLLAWPSVGLFTLTWMIAFYALLAGFSMLGLAFQLRAKAHGGKRRLEV